MQAPSWRAFNEHSNVTMDVGQIVFGNAVTMTSDGPLEYRIQKMTGHKWCNDDVECETGGGIVPMEYKIKSVASAVQWITGMELFARQGSLEGCADDRPSQRRAIFFATRRS